MNTNQNTTTAPSPVRPTLTDTCRICGGEASARFSHRVEDRAYYYVWCGRCSYGVYVHLYTI